MKWLRRLLLLIAILALLLVGWLFLSLFGFWLLRWTIMNVRQ